MNFPSSFRHQFCSVSNKTFTISLLKRVRTHTQLLYITKLQYIQIILGGWGGGGFHNWIFIYNGRRKTINEKDFPFFSQFQPFHIEVASV